MIITIVLANTSITSHNDHFFSGVRAFKIYSLINFKSIVHLVDYNYHTVQCCCPHCGQWYLGAVVAGLPKKSWSECFPGITRWILTKQSFLLLEFLSWKGQVKEERRPTHRRNWPDNSLTRLSLRVGMWPTINLMTIRLGMFSSLADRKSYREILRLNTKSERW